MHFHINRANGVFCAAIEGLRGKQAHLNKVARRLNERPRKTLEFDATAERFNACVALTG
jgi:hypothetical protein